MRALRRTTTPLAAGLVLALSAGAAGASSELNGTGQNVSDVAEPIGKRLDSFEDRKFARDEPSEFLFRILSAHRASMESAREAGREPEARPRGRRPAAREAASYS